MNVRCRVAAIALVALSLGMAACGGTYYLVKDLESGQEYYTTKVDRSSHGMTFKDGKRLSTVTLQNSEVIEITRDQYRANTGAR
jgi:hypothetical protein